MPTVTPDQGLTLPLQGDPANEQTAMSAYNAGVEPRLVHFYTNAADRTARNPAPVAGEISYLATPGRMDWCQSAVGPVWWEMQPIWVRKQNNVQTVNNSTALVNDSFLILPYQANARYTLDGLVAWDSGTTADIKFSWAISGAGATMPRWQITAVGTTLAFDAAIGAAVTDVLTRGGAGIGSLIYGVFKGHFVTGANAGNLTLTWAQNALEAVATRVQTDSWLQLTRVG